jgi:tetratricopeptide (TPR) repeat protein
MLAEAYRAKREYPTALRHSLQAVKYGYHYPRVFLQNGRLYAHTGDHRSAIVAYRRFLTLVPDRIAVAELAWILATHWDERIRNIDEALELARFAAQSPEGKTKALDALAAAEAMRGRTRVAASLAERAYQRALTEGDVDYANEIKLRLEIYRDGQAFRLPRP